MIMNGELQCRWRDDRPLPGDRYYCHSPKLIVGASGVTLDTCKHCYLRDHTPPAPVELPSIITQAQTFLSEMTKWIASGRPRTTPTQQAERKAICDDCSDKVIVNGQDRCAKCGCNMQTTPWFFGTVETPGKLEMATSECPVGKWKSLL